MTSRTKRVAGFKKLYGKADRKKAQKNQKEMEKPTLTLDEFVAAWAAAQAKKAPPLP